MSATDETASSTRPRRTRLTAEARRAQILEAAREVFLRSGADGARVHQLADAAGVNTALLYQHFDSKQEIFEEAVAAPIAEAFQASLAHITPPTEFDSSGEQMRKLTRDYVRALVHAMHEIAPLLGLVLFNDAESGRDYYQHRLAPLLAQVRAVIVEHLPVWDHIDFDPELVFSLVFGMSWYIAIEDRFRAGPPRDPEHVTDQIATLIFDGLLRH